MKKRLLDRLRTPGLVRNRRRLGQEKLARLDFRHSEPRLRRDQACKTPLMPQLLHGWRSFASNLANPSIHRKNIGGKLASFPFLSETRTLVASLLRDSEEAEKGRGFKLRRGRKILRSCTPLEERVSSRSRFQMMSNTSRVSNTNRAVRDLFGRMLSGRGVYGRLPLGILRSESPIDDPWRTA